MPKRTWLVMIVIGYAIVSPALGQVFLDFAGYGSDFGYHAPAGIRAGKDASLHRHPNDLTASMYIGYIKYHTGSGPYDYYIMSGNAGVEFDLARTINGGVFPTSGMTILNWRAYLDIETRPFGFANGMNIGIHNLQDPFEDGQITDDDYDNPGENISSCYAPNEAAASVHDVTEALRHDLFDDRPTDAFSGFIFIHYGAGATNPFILSAHPLRIVVTPLSTGTPTTIPTSTATPVPTTVQTETPTPEPSATPEPWTGVRFDFPSNRFTGGDAFILKALCQGREQDERADLVVALDIAGHFWFYPNWSTAFETSRLDLNGTEMVPVSILDFTWPEGNYGQMNNLKFWGAILVTGKLALIGDLDWVSFDYY